MPRLTCATALCFAALLSEPAAAQFGSIFGEPPRPPQGVPTRPPARNPWDQPAPWDRPPPPPSPQTDAPSARPTAPGGIQSQPLPPPPGVSPAQQQGGLPRPPASAGRPAAPDAATQTQPTGQPPLPGLPPGQRQPRGAPVPPGTSPVAAAPGDEVVIAPPAQKIPNGSAVFSGLDKITGRIITFDVAIDETVQFGALQVTPRVCYTRPPTETPNTDSFLEVDEITLQGEVRRIFTGWMFASSPGLHAVEHPIYDVWLVDCKNAKPAIAGAQTPPPPGAAPRR